MSYDPSSPFYRILSTRYDEEREDEALEILSRHPEIAKLTWPDPDEQGQPFIQHSTALHYAANDGKNRLVLALIEHGADVNSSKANWYRSVLSWAANNARVDTIRTLLDHGADPKSLDAMHAAAWGGSGNGEDEEEAYLATLDMLLDAGALLNGDPEQNSNTPYDVAIESGHKAAIEWFQAKGGKRTS